MTEETTPPSPDKTEKPGKVATLRNVKSDVEKLDPDQKDLVTRLRELTEMALKKEIVGIYGVVIPADPEDELENVIEGTFHSTGEVYMELDMIKQLLVIEKTKQILDIDDDEDDDESDDTD